MSIFIAPHSDDEVLWGSFSILRARPLVVIVYDGHVQAQRGHNVKWQQRREESKAAMRILGKVGIVFLGLSDADRDVTADTIRGKLFDHLGHNIFDTGETIFSPAAEVDGHPQHNLVSEAVGNGPTVVRYLTYTTAGKSVSTKKVPIRDPRWIGLKLKALACYESQWAPELGCWPHFIAHDQMEYYAE